MGEPGFFDVDERLARLSGLGDQLEAFAGAVNFERFRPDLEKAPWSTRTAVREAALHSIR
jgi:hypothetical protein